MRECRLAYLTISSRYELSSFVAWVTNSQNKDVSQGQKEQAAASEKQLILTIFYCKAFFFFVTFIDLHEIVPGKY